MYRTVREYLRSTHQVNIRRRRVQIGHRCFKNSPSFSFFSSLSVCNRNEKWILFAAGNERNRRSEPTCSRHHQTECRTSRETSTTLSSIWWLDSLATTTRAFFSFFFFPRMLNKRRETICMESCDGIKTERVLSSARGVEIPVQAQKRRGGKKRLSSITGDSHILRRTSTFIFPPLSFPDKMAKMNNKRNTFKIINEISKKSSLHTHTHTQ